MSMKFIKLTHAVGGAAFWINPDHIQSINYYGSTSSRIVMTTRETDFLAKESPDQIIDLIRQSKWQNK